MKLFSKFLIFICISLSFQIEIQFTNECYFSGDVYKLDFDYINSFTISEENFSSNSFKLKDVKSIKIPNGYKLIINHRNETTNDIFCNEHNIFSLELQSLSYKINKDERELNLLILGNIQNSLIKFSQNFNKNETYIREIKEKSKELLQEDYYLEFRGKIECMFEEINTRNRKSLERIYKNYSNIYESLLRKGNYFNKKGCGLMLSISQNYTIRKNKFINGVDELKREINEIKFIKKELNLPLNLIEKRIENSIKSSILNSQNKNEYTICSENTKKTCDFTENSVKTDNFAFRLLKDESQKVSQERFSDQEINISILMNDYRNFYLSFKNKIEAYKKLFDDFESYCEKYFENYLKCMENQRDSDILRIQILYVSDIIKREIVTNKNLVCDGKEYEDHDIESFLIQTLKKYLLTTNQDFNELLKNIKNLLKLKNSKISKEENFNGLLLCISKYILSPENLKKCTDFFINEINNSIIIS